MGVFRASNHEQETLGAIGSNRKQQEVAAVYSPTTNLGQVVVDGRRHGVSNAWYLSMGVEE